MNFATIVRAGVIGSALAATLTQGYNFAETSDVSTDSVSEENTGLTTNEEQRIFGGSEADASQFPYIVSLRKDGADEKTYCGGTLIASQYVVTAAHCVKTDETTIYASIGSAFGTGSGDGEQLKVIEGYTHPLYNKSDHLYDVGVLKLEKEVSTATIGLCSADGSDNQVGTVATVRGWGLTENGSRSLMLQEVNVKIITNTECNKQYSNRITEGMLCAGEGNGKDSCNGDSGGPLIANDALVGIVSWGGKCGVDAGVYTRISYVLDYIKDVIGGGTGSTFTESIAGLADQGEDETSGSFSTEGTEAHATKKTITEASFTEAPTVAPISVTPTPKITTEAPATDIPATDASDTENTSTHQNDKDESSTSANQNESTTDSAEQNYPAESEASSPATIKRFQNTKDCATQF